MAATLRPLPPAGEVLLACAAWWAKAVHPWRFGLGPEAEQALDRMAERIPAGP